MNPDAVEDIYPLTVTQQGMAFHALAGGGAGTFAEQLCVTLVGELDPAALRRAWQLLVEREPMLRSAVVWEGMEEPLLVVLGGVELPLTELDWTDRADPGPALAELAHAERVRPFEITQPPLMRITTVRLPGNRTRLLWTFHHLLLDGWSMALLLRDLATAYRCLVAGASVPAPRRLPFRNYVAWLRDQDESGAEKYWREALEGCAEPTPLGIDEARAGRHVDAYGEHELRLPVEVSTMLGQLSRDHGVTLSTVVEGAWARLLSAYSGHDEVVFGITSSGRAAPVRGIESMVGMFINAIPVRAAVPLDLPAWDWLADLQVRQTARQAYEWAPLLRIQGWSDVPDDGPLFETALVFENYPLDAAAWDWGDGLAAEQPRYVGGRANHPLTLFVLPGTSLTLRAVYDAHRFPEERIALLLVHLSAILTTLATGRSVPVAELGPLGAHERQWLVGGADHGRDRPARVRTVPELFAEQAAGNPDGVAAVADGTRVTYRELRRRVLALANQLEERHSCS